MIPLSVRVIMYGFGKEVPKGGFPTNGYSEIMTERLRMKNTSTIYPENTGNLLDAYYHKVQRTRWGFKRLLLRWNEYRFKNQYGNEEDLYGNPFEEYSEDEPIVTIWDWRSLRYYRFGYQEIIDHMYSKLITNHHPTNPYINVPLTLSQCTRIQSFLDEHCSIHLQNDKNNLVYSYSRYPTNLFLNSQLIMKQNGFCTIQDQIPTGPCTPAEEILLDEIIGCPFKIRNDKKEMADQFRTILYRLIVNESNEISYVPDTKQEKQMYEIYARHGLMSVIAWYQNWIRENRKRFYLRRHIIRGPFYKFQNGV